MNEKSDVLSNFQFQAQGPLWMASKIGHLDLVKTLIGAGANVNQTNKVGIYTNNCTHRLVCIYVHETIYM